MLTIDDLTKPSAPHAEYQFGTTEGAKPSIEDNIPMLVDKLGPIAYMRQVHGSKLQYAAKPGIYEETDALFTDRPDIWLAVNTADCLPILISSPEAIAVVHAGWRGLQKELLPKTLLMIMEEFAQDPTKVFLSVGPCIRQYNYEVEESFATIFDDKFFKPSTKKGHLLMDLPAIARQQAKDVGVLDLNIFDCGIDTFSDKRFFSYRRSKKSGEAKQVQPSLIRRKQQRSIMM